MGRILAAADIGSNTAHLLVAEMLSNRSMRRILNESEWLSLGEAVARTGEVPEEKAIQLIALLRNYEGLALARQAEHLYVFATEAMRAARNGAETMSRIESETGIRVHVISPQLEADLSLQGALLDAPSGIGLLIEVGGGSAQVAICNGANSVEREFSLPIGTGRLIVAADLQQPASPRALETLRETVHSLIEQLPRSVLVEGLTVASGGVGRGLWRALHRDGEKTLERREIEFLAWSCANLSIAQIVARFGVKPKRAAALLPGAVAYLAILERFGVDRIFVSEFGVREGAIRQLAEGTTPAWLA